MHLTQTKAHTHKWGRPVSKAISIVSFILNGKWFNACWGVACQNQNTDSAQWCRLHEWGLPHKDSGGDGEWWHVSSKIPRGAQFFTHGHSNTDQDPIHWSHKGHSVWHTTQSPAVLDSYQWVYVFPIHVNFSSTLSTLCKEFTLL